MPPNPIEVALPEEASAPRHADAGQAFPAGNDSTRYDVVVVGAGLGGLAVAIFLACAGRRVVCIEPEPFPRERVGESLDWSTPALLRALGLAFRGVGSLVGTLANLATSSINSRQQPNLLSLGGLQAFLPPV